MLKNCSANGWQVCKVLLNWQLGAADKRINKRLNLWVAHEQFCDAKRRSLLGCVVNQMSEYDARGMKLGGEA